MRSARVETSKLIRLYKSGLGLREIAMKVGMTHQAVHDRLKRAGFRIYHRPYTVNKPPPLNPTDVRRLYVEERLALAEVAKRLDTGIERVKAALAREGVVIRRRGRVPRKPEWAAMQVGRSVELVRAGASDHRYYLYKIAKRWRVRVRVNKLGGGRWRLTRVA